MVEGDEEAHVALHRDIHTNTYRHSAAHPDKQTFTLHVTEENSPKFTCTYWTVSPPDPFSACYGAFNHITWSSSPDVMALKPTLTDQGRKWRYEHLQFCDIWANLLMKIMRYDRKLQLLQQLLNGPCGRTVSNIKIEPQLIHHVASICS